jgi:hypothetical protein
MRTITAWVRAIVGFFSEILFGCSHGRLTRPFTIHEETYMVCLDCGKQVYYSANEMRPLNPWEVRRMKAARAGEVKVVPIPAGMQPLVPVGEHNPKVAA